METSEFVKLTPAHASRPAHLHDRLQAAAPRSFGRWAITQHLRGESLACFAPFIVLQAAHGVVQALRNDDLAAVSGFHSPVGEGMLRVLLENKVPAIVGSARSLQRIRIPSAWRRPLKEGRLLVISLFEALPRSPTRKSSRQRDEFIAAISDEVLVFHADPGGNIERPSRKIDGWRIPRR